MTGPACVGQLVWRRHVRTSNPSRHALRATCMQLLPLLEMYCKYELQDDCSNLRELMLRFDSEAELETHELGRSLLHMLRDDDAGMEMYTQRMQFDAPSNPFYSIRGRLAEIDSAFRALQPQVRLHVDTNCLDRLAGMPTMAFGMPKCVFTLMCRNKIFNCSKFHCGISSLLCLVVVCLPASSGVCIHLPLACILVVGRARSHLLCHFWRRCACVACSGIFSIVSLALLSACAAAAIPAGTYERPHFRQTSVHVRRCLCTSIKFFFPIAALWDCPAALSFRHFILNRTSWFPFSFASRPCSV